MKKNIKIILTILVVLVIIVLAVCIALKFQKSKEVEKDKITMGNDVKEEILELRKSYQNDEYGFEFDYLLPTTECKDSCRLESYQNKIVVGRTTLLIEDSNGLNVYDFAEKNTKDFIINKKENIEIGGVPGVVVDYRFGGANRFGKVAFVEKNNIVYILNFTAGAFCCSSGESIYELEFFDDVISTFHFIDEGEVEDETADWKVYRNEKNGFEFKYPSDIYSYPSAEQLKEITMHEELGCLRGGFSYRFDYLNSFRISVCDQEEKTLRQWIANDISTILLDQDNESYDIDNIIDEILLNSEEITVDGRYAIKIFSLPNFRVCNAYPQCLIVKAYFSDNGKIFSLGLYNGGSGNSVKEKEHFIDQILSTFRFIN